MPTNIKISKEQILDAAFNIVKKDGAEALNNRRIAKELGCSIRPIYYQFKNSDELKSELINKIRKYYFSYITDNLNENIPKFKQYGMRLVMFAKNDSNLFKLLFSKKSNLSYETFIINDDFKKISELMKKSAKLDDKELKNIFMLMWIFAYGISWLLANETCTFSEEQISKLLSYEFQAHMLLEENPDNKWVLKGGMNNDRN